MAITDQSPDSNEQDPANDSEAGVVQPLRLSDGASVPWPREPQGNSHQLNAFKTQAENEIDRHRQQMDALVEELADAHGDLDAGRATEAQDASTYATAIDQNDIANHNARAPWAAPRRASGLAVAVITAVACVVWFFINTFALAGLALTRLFTRGPLAALSTALAAPILACVVACASSRSASLAGRAAKDIAFTPGEFLDPDVPEARKTRQHATWFGVGVEVFMGLVRVLAVRSIVTATLLFAASMSLWLAVRRANFEHRSRQIETVKSTTAAVKKTGRDLGDARADLRSDWGRVNGLLGQLRGVGEKCVNIVNGMWSQAVTAYRHDNPGAHVPAMPKLHGYQTFLDLAAGKVPEHLELNPLEFTDVEGLRTHPRRPVSGRSTNPPDEWGPPALGPGRPQ